MKFHAALFSLFFAGALFTGCAYVKHVPPGQSLSAAMARKPELVALPTPTRPPVAVNVPAPGAVDPLPPSESVEDSLALGNLCMHQGRYPEAITAYETALKADPSLAEAWNNLAIAYQNIGQDDKAMAAFRKYKMVALH
jgi:tetratricopeptide (TPR) repeat protein